MRGLSRLYRKVYTMGYYDYFTNHSMYSSRLRHIRRGIQKYYKDQHTKILATPELFIL